MRITAITLENFKGIREPVRVELKPITLLFGPNSAGKSTILQALHYAREILEHQNLNPDRTSLGGSSIDLGGFESLVHQHDLDRAIRIKLEFCLDDGILPEFYLYHADEFVSLHPVMAKNIWIELNIKWNQLLEQPIVTKYSVGINEDSDEDIVEDSFATVECSYDGKQVFLSSIKHQTRYLMYLDENYQMIDMLNELNISFEHTNQDSYDIFLPLLGQRTVIPDLDSPLKYKNPDRKIWTSDGEDIPTLEIEEESSGHPYIEANHILSSLIVGPGQIARDLLRKFCYIGPLREVPNRNFLPPNFHDHSRWANGLGAYDILFEDEGSLTKDVNKWLLQNERLNAGYRVNIRKYRELSVNSPLSNSTLNQTLLDEDEDILMKELETLPIKKKLIVVDVLRKTELDLHDIGVGISQVLPVLVSALHHRTGIVAIEQPELHIHPAFQVALGDLFIEQIREKENLTFILETHSEHLILRMLRRIRENEERKDESWADSEEEDHPLLSPDDLSINFIEPNESGGVDITTIGVDEDGDFIDRWPRGFFSERAKELF